MPTPTRRAAASFSNASAVTPPIRISKEIVVFIENETTSAALRERFPVLGHPKTRLLEHGRRLTYSLLFAYANLYLNPTLPTRGENRLFFGKKLPAEALK